MASARTSAGHRQRTHLDAKVKLSGLNLRGADLTSLFLGQAHIQDARLEGAKLADIDLDEGSISGSIDWMTELPEGDCRSRQ